LKRSVIYVLFALMLALGAAFVACGGGSDKSNNDQAQPTAEQQDNQNGQDQQAEPTAKATQQTKATVKPGNSGDSSGSIGDVPVYPGADKKASGEWSGSEAPIPALGSGVDAGSYAKVQYAMYETSDSAQNVLDWYKDKMSDWKDEGSFSGGSEGGVGGFAAWTKDDGKEAAWISVSEDSGTTTLGIFFGSQ
jgi:hypothetical protein